jgi:hypothetical protein
LRSFFGFSGFLGLLGLLLNLFDDVLEVLEEDGSVLARALDVVDVVLVNFVLLHRPLGGSRQLERIRVRLGVRVVARLKRLDVGEEDGPVLARALATGEVDAVVPGVLRRGWGNLELVASRRLCDLEVLHSELAVLGSPLETLDCNRVHGCVLGGRFRSERRVSRLLGLDQQFLGQQSLGVDCLLEQVHVVVLERDVEDELEVEGGGSHD